MLVTIAKFELYPETDPTGYAVGFNITLDNGRSFYRDTVVVLGEAAKTSDDEEIIAIGWDQLFNDIIDEKNRLEGKSQLLGNVWVPLDKIALDSAITNAQRLLDTAVEGTDPGEYASNSIATLQAAVDEANTVRSSATTQEQLNLATDKLSTATVVFRNSIIGG